MADTLHVTYDHNRVNGPWVAWLESDPHAELVFGTWAQFREYGAGRGWRIPTRPPTKAPTAIPTGTVPGMGPQPAPLNHPTRRFEIHRDTDVSGISGTGLVAEGVEFRDGTVVVRWLPSSKATPTTVVHQDIANVQALHGHAGSSRIVWIDARE